MASVFNEQKGRPGDRSVSSFERISYTWLRNMAGLSEAIETYISTCRSTMTCGRMSMTVLRRSNSNLTEVMRMIIGLLRHFKVNCQIETRMDSAAFMAWNHQYDIADVICKPIDLRGIQWTRCWSSNLPRALTTADACGIPYKVDARLREVPMSPDLKTLRKKITLWWMIRSRLAWRKDHPSQSEGKKLTTQRIESFLDEMFQEIQPHDNVLLVCHGFLMRELRRILVRRGFNGEKFSHAKNGQVYLLRSN